MTDGGSVVAGSQSLLVQANDLGVFADQCGCKRAFSSGAGKNRGDLVAAKPCPDCSSRLEVRDHACGLSGETLSPSVIFLSANGGEVLVTLTERRSRLHLIRRVRARTAGAVCRAVVGTLAPISRLVLTLTSDNGKEFAEHEIIALACKADFYFAKPYASWQRGSNENGNGLVRYYLPKGADFATVTDEQLKEIERRIKSRPRKTLGWRTPYEVFAEALKKRVAIRS